MLNISESRSYYPKMKIKCALCGIELLKDDRIANFVDSQIIHDIQYKEEQGGKNFPYNYPDHRDCISHINGEMLVCDECKDKIEKKMVIKEL